MKLVLWRASACNNKSIEDVGVDAEKYNVYVERGIEYFGGVDSRHERTYVVISINSLEELNEFIEDYGDIIIYKEVRSRSDVNTKGLCIYDFYIE